MLLGKTIVYMFMKKPRKYNLWLSFEKAAFLHKKGRLLLLQETSSKKSIAYEPIRLRIFRGSVLACASID